ncbi:MAG: TlpA disulfide reductase family protein [Planctomycetaceae bacterium]
MHRHVPALLLLLWFLTVPASAVDKPILFWASGDSLEGQLLSADSKSLTWQTPLFADPLNIRLPVLAAIRFPDDESQPIDDLFRIVLRNGDVLSGTLTAVSDTAFGFESRRHGQFRLHRDQIRNLRRINTPGLFYLGPQGLDGWTRPGSTDSPENWREELGGHLATSKSEAAIFRALKLPETCEIEVVLQSTGQPSFMMAFNTDETNSLRLETWANVLVVLSGLEFNEIDTLTDEQRKVHLHLFLDRRAGTLSVYRDNGQKLAQMQGSPERSPETGLLFRNGDGNLTLTHLRVSQWDGNPPQELKAGESRVHLPDGTIQYGRLSGVSDDGSRLKFAAGDDVTELAISELSTIIVNDDPEIVPGQSAARVVWEDGSIVSGKISEIRGNMISVSTDYSDTPITSAMNGVRRISLPATEMPSDEPDQLFFDGGALKGNLIVQDGQESPIRWKPLGGINASALAGGGDARFLRGAAATEITFDQQSFPDVIYLVNDDVLPCRLESSSEDSVTISTPLSEVRQIAAEHVKAVELLSGGRSGQTGFDTDGWKRINGSAKITKDTIEFATTGGVGHPSVLSGDTVQFRLKWNSEQISTLSLMLFADRLGMNTETATSIGLVCAGDQLQISDGKRNADPQMAFMMMQGVAQGGNSISVKDQTANIVLTIVSGELHIAVDGTEVRSVKLNPDGIGQSGMLIQAQAIGGPARVRGFQGRVGSSGGGMEISNFRVGSRAGASIRAFINDEVRELTLTVPRFRRNDPPTHVLIAPNGDLLRGRLVAVSDSEITFESRLEQFRFERNRVAAIIWLGPLPESTDTAGSDDHDDAANAAIADAGPANERAGDPDETGFVEVTDAPADNPRKDADQRPALPGGIQAILDGGFNLTMTPAIAVDGKLIGHSPELGQCTVPASAISELFVGHPESRQKIVTYTRWVPKRGLEPDWDIPDAGAAQVSPLIGQEVADFELPTLDGETFRLSDHADKVIVLDFWATWCGPCVMALPQYVDATSEFHDSKVIFVAVNLQEESNRIREFLEKQNLSPVVALDRGSVVAQQFGVSGIPHSVILGPGNVVEYVHVGYREGIAAEVKDTIQKILDGRWERPAKE